MRTSSEPRFEGPPSQYPTRQMALLTRQGTRAGGRYKAADRRAKNSQRSGARAGCFDSFGRRLTHTAVDEIFHRYPLQPRPPVTLAVRDQ